MYSGPITSLFKVKYNFCKSILNSAGARFQFKGEQTTPVKTVAFPGPNHINSVNMTQNGFVGNQRFVNFRKSYGSYLADNDNNQILDLNAAAAGQILGYNNQDLVNARDCVLYDKYVTHKMNINLLPPDEISNIIRELTVNAAPKGMVQLNLAGGNTQSEANEAAVAVAFQKYAKENNVAVNKLVAVSFEKSNHGNTTGALSFSSKEANFNNAPAFPWPKAEIPQLKFPVWKHEAELKADEQRCLQGFRDIIQNTRSAGQQVGAVIIAPVNSLDNHSALPTFYKNLRKICKSEGIPFIVDETETGVGATGKNWAHEHWFLEDSPDLMTFGGKAGLGGFFSSLNFRLDDASQFSQNVDITKLLHFAQIFEAFERNHVFYWQNDTSQFLKIELARVGRENPHGIVNNLRGNGVHLGWDTKNEATANSLENWFARANIRVARLGSKTFGLRPAVNMTIPQGAILRNSLLNYSPNFQQ